MFHIKYNLGVEKPAFHDKLAEFVGQDLGDGCEYPLKVENEAGQVYCTITAYGMRAWGDINDFLYEQGMRDKYVATGRDGHYVMK